MRGTFSKSCKEFSRSFMFQYQAKRMEPLKPSKENGVMSKALSPFIKSSSTRFMWAVRTSVVYILPLSILWFLTNGSTFCMKFKKQETDMVIITTDQRKIYLKSMKIIMILIVISVNHRTKLPMVADKNVEELIFGSAFFMEFHIQSSIFFYSFSTRVECLYRKKKQLVLITKDMVS
uniref:Uncharacterized protein n=1 Tax=Glossina pallidipes TaxID=7398 RepID=A0A1A9Z8A0_GLOPL